VQVPVGSLFKHIFKLGCDDRQRDAPRDVSGRRARTRPGSRRSLRPGPAEAAVPWHRCAHRTPIIMMMAAATLRHSLRALG
jgi:hypothetical protein